jgi:hypothetical protein
MDFTAVVALLSVTLAAGCAVAARWAVRPVAPAPVPVRIDDRRR